MSISTVPTSTAVYTPASASPPVKQGIVNVNTALAGGDLAAAQSAFFDLAQVATPDPNSPYAAGIKGLSDALRAGDLTGAQDALTDLQHQVREARASDVAQPYGNAGATAATGDPSEFLNISA